MEYVTRTTNTVTMNTDCAYLKHNHRDPETIKKEMENDPGKYFDDISKDRVLYLSSHKIRFSNCTTLLENGVDIREVQYAMGHTEQRMTEHYNRPCPNKAANPMISMVLTKGVTYV